MPSTTSHRVPFPSSAEIYRNHVVERMCCRLKDWRWIAPRYDKLTRNFLAAAQIAAAFIGRPY